MESNGSPDPTSPSKVARIDTHRGPSATLTHLEKTSGPSRFTGRGPTACETCRNRKTKCDNQRPTCGYCARVNASCTYLDESASYLHLNTIPQLFQSIENLTRLLQLQQASPSTPFSPSALHISDQAHTLSQYQHHHHYYYNRAPKVIPPESSKLSGQKVATPGGLDSVLKWKAFPQPCPAAITVFDDPISYPQSDLLPSTEISELLRLKAKYTAYVHIKNPTLNLSTLHELTKQVAEYGFDWSTRTCMVSLVCALGAISERYKLDRSNDQLLLDNCSENDTEIAFRYWNVAVKRLGLVIGQSNLETVQCLCLTGIWYMYNMQPLQGWKYFALASNTWYSTTISRSPTFNEDEDDRLLALEQSLYFTCFKSEWYVHLRLQSAVGKMSRKDDSTYCELVFELSLPKSVLEGIEYPHTFPSPPYFDRHLTLGENNIEKRSWYYYLAEIACRHMINRIVQANQDNPVDPSTRGVERLLEVVEMFESQLNDWYLSLPTSVNFPLPTGTIHPLEDELRQLLRARYLGIRELCYRPFVQLAVNYHINSGPETVAKVTTIASQCLQYCMFRLQAIPPQTRHHGLWFQLPNSTTCALILLAVDRAKHDPALNALENVRIPLGWHEQILITRDLLARYWKDRQGGIWECFRVLDWVIDGCRMPH